MEEELILRPQLSVLFLERHGILILFLGLSVGVGTVVVAGMASLHFRC